MKLSAEIRNQKELTDLLGKLAGGELRKAYALALNDTGFMVRGKQVAALNGAFDRVTPFVGRSPKVFKATAEKLSVSIAPTLHTDRNAFVRGGKEGVDPQDVLQVQEFGGRRRDKRSEVILRRAGWLPAGYQTAIPRSPFPGSDDGRGNLNGPFLRSVLSFLQAYQSGQGYDQNMGRGAIANVRGYGKARITKRQKQQAGPFMGRSYFVAGGRAAVTWDNKPYRFGAGKTAHLQPGIWAALGIGKARQIRPVLMFVRAGSYQPRIDMDRVARDAGVQEYLDKRVRFRVRQAVGV